MTSDTFRLVISTKFIDQIERFLELDTCTSKSIKASSRIAESPLQDGSVLSDHMYRQPDTFDVSGSFSLNGRHMYEGSNSFSADNIFYTPSNQVVDANMKTELAGLFGDRLTAIQTVFEYIKNRGLLCTLTTLSGDPEKDNELRFKVRKNMALTSITWTEKYNSMQYNFGFQEVMQVSMQVYEVAGVVENLYPVPTMPASKSLGAVIAENGTLYQTIIELLLDNDYIALEDGAAFSIKNDHYNGSIGIININSALVAAGIAAALVAAIIIAVAIKTAVVGVVLGTVTGMGAVAGIGAAIFPVGTVIVAAAALIAGLVFGVASAIENSNREAKLKTGFNLILNYKSYIDGNTYKLKNGINPSSLTENSGDIARVRQLLDLIQAEVDKQFNDIQVYELSTSSTDNDPFTSAIQIGQDIYYFTFTRTEDVDTVVNGATIKNYSWSIKILDGVGPSAKEIKPYFSWAPVSKLSECSMNSNIICRDSSMQYEAYLLCPSLATANTAEEEANIRSHLVSYQIIVSRGSIEVAMKKLNKIIVTALENNNFIVEGN